MRFLRDWQGHFWIRSLARVFSRRKSFCNCSDVFSLAGVMIEFRYYDSKNGKVTTAGKGERISGVEVLTNAQVNLVSVILSSALGAFVVGPMLYP